MISNSTFSNNLKSGITVVDLIGHSQILRTVATRNNAYGLRISNTQGRLCVLSSVFVHNKYGGVSIYKMTGSLEFENVNSSRNQASGIAIDAGTLSFQMSDSRVEENVGQGLHISNQINSTINISNTHFILNSNGEGVYLQAFSYCYIRLTEILSLGNSQNGALFSRVTDTRLEVNSCTFDGNAFYGVHVDYVFSGKLNFKKISTSKNYKSGFIVRLGDTSIHIESWSSVSNHNDGFYIENQEGEVIVKDSAVHFNKRNGLWFIDHNSARLQSVHLVNCSVSGSSQFGVLFYLISRFNQGTENYTITVTNSTISNNALGGCKLYPSGCYWRSFTRQRRVKLLFADNKLEGNRKFGLDIYGPELYELNAVLANNRFYENSGHAMITVAYYDHSCADYYSFPVNVQVVSNIFMKNRGEYTFFVDFKSLPTKRHIIIRNNTFLGNQGIRSFSSGYLRTKTQAVLAVKEGNVIVKHNSFVNPLFPHELAVLLKDHERVIQAGENWWGTRDECKLKDRIFDFEDRVELALIHYYPFLDSYNSTSAKLHNGVRPFCFLRGNKLGGTLNQAVNITKDFTAYQVIGDVTVLPDGVLTIEENVTLEFPLKGVFLVHGQVIIKGTDKERVKFIPKAPSEKEIRLVEGPTQWEGKVEIWLNSTWMPVCINTYRYEYEIVCRQIGYEAVSSHYHNPSGKESIFLHNVRCDTDQGDNITNCNGDNWISSSLCSAYVLYVGCKIPYWAGIHLPVTPKKSVISNVDIHYAGFAYRDDLGIPGIAFRVDLSRHKISGVFVTNSAAIGFQMMYPDPFNVSPDIVNSTISKTESDGIRLETPFLNLLTINVANTKGYGFLYYYNWKSLNTHVVKIADATVKKFVDVCSKNETFIDDSSLFYYLVVTSKSTSACEKIIAVPQNYSIGLQLIHHDVSSSVAFHVYGGKTKTSNTLWDIHSLRWSSRPVWTTSNNSILLESSYHYRDYVSTVHLLLFLIKGKIYVTYSTLTIMLLVSSLYLILYIPVTLF